MEQKYFTLIHNDKNIAHSSSSGGAFTAVSDSWFDLFGDDALVYGCILNENLDAVHTKACNKSERDLMRGSKYIQSNTNGIYRSVEDDLKSKKHVLFSGTPCQISALNNYLKIKNIPHENLITVEVICHGVGSNAFFEDYISNMEKKYKSNAVSCNFRAKSRPEKLQDMKVSFKNGKVFNASTTKYDWFYTAYLKNYILRPACYSCPFATKERFADISLADNWGGKTKEPASLVIANTNVGLDLINSCAVSSMIEEIAYDNINQPNMLAPSSKPKGYDEFWTVYEKSGYLAAQTFLGNNTTKAKIKTLIADLLYSLHLDVAVKKTVSLLKR